ncbi:hypothetical protein BIW11_02991 [Tropilaelaps mercedesae]|uniref:Uncharacterized protein n=1 Tax=Tropilaelaps mercedesae TaxID=418985 RepID=A0A1V9XTX0_9ACAR|nr:hypothetical protein BIW11_02991 [Tropilaelaps mercedesae]
MRVQTHGHAFHRQACMTPTVVEQVV